MSDEKFGTDLGLVQQAVVMGRRVGADHTFWSCLAHNDTLFAKVVKFAKQELEPSAEDRATILQWIATMETEFPIEERESYYANSSHCDFNETFRNLGREGLFQYLFRKAEYNSAARTLCAEIECLFILAYTYSAVYAEKHFIDRKDWFHGPIWGLVVTFNEIWRDDSRAFSGRYLGTEGVHSNQPASLVHLAAEKYEILRKDDPRGAALDEVLSVCREQRNAQAQKIAALVASIGQ